MKRTKDTNGINLDNQAITQELFQEIAGLIENSRKRVALTVNSEITLLYWQIGKQIKKTLLNNDCADYGEQILATLSQQLNTFYGKGFTKSALHRIVAFFSFYRDGKKVATLSRQLSWSHIIELLTIKDATKRKFYEELYAHEGCSIRLLRERMSSMLFERTALSKQPAKLIKDELNTVKEKGITSQELVFPDPYILDFLGLQDTYSEQDLETAILNNLQKFIIELGGDFAFIARQKRIVIDQEDYRIDLLFYHRGLRRLMAIDLKLDRFKAAYKDQMELYLKWLDKYERKEGEESPIGLILCSVKQQEQIELLELNKGHIKVAEYMT